jgi:hypothetical protein
MRWRLSVRAFGDCERAHESLGRLCKGRLPPTGNWPWSVLSGSRVAASKIRSSPNRLAIPSAFRISAHHAGEGEEEDGQSDHRHLQGTLIGALARHRDRKGNLRPPAEGTGHLTCRNKRRGEERENGRKAGTERLGQVGSFVQPDECTRAESQLRTRARAPPPFPSRKTTLKHPRPLIRHGTSRIVLFGGSRGTDELSPQGSRYMP